MSETSSPKVGGASYEAHPLAEMFPMLPDRELMQLAYDIRDNGQAEPIILYEGKILDGRNRHQACRVLKIEPVFAEFDGTDPLAYVVSKNLHRRHLSDSQRSAIAGRLADAKAGGMRDPERANLRGREEISNARAAELLNVSERSVQTAKKIIRDGEPEVIAAVQAGAMSLNEASNIVQLRPDQQKEVVKLPKDERRRVTTDEVFNEKRPSKAASKRISALEDALAELAEIRATPAEILAETPAHRAPNINESIGRALLFMEALRAAHSEWEHRNVSW